MEQPNPHDFGVTPEEYMLYARNELDERTLLSVTVLSSVSTITGILAVLFIITQDIVSAFLWGIVFCLPPAIAVPYIVYLSISKLIRLSVLRFKRFRLMKSPVIFRISQYEEAATAYQVVQQEANQAHQAAERAALEAEWAKQEVARVQRLKVHDRWMSMSGLEFEREMGSLYRRLGYNVQMTATSGDHGIDLILRKNGKTIVVQCKSHQAPVGESVARDLLGSMHAVRADSAILACTGGFTRSARKFVEAQPIKLITVQDIIALADSIELGEVAEPADNAPSIVAPVCPMPGCGKVMALRKGRYGLFWGCPDYPKCRGTRDATGR